MINLPISPSARRSRPATARFSRGARQRRGGPRRSREDPRSAATRDAPCPRRASRRRHHDMTFYRAAKSAWGARADVVKAQAVPLAVAELVQLADDAHIRGAPGQRRRRLAAAQHRLDQITGKRFSRKELRVGRCVARPSALTAGRRQPWQRLIRREVRRRGGTDRLSSGSPILKRAAPRVRRGTAALYCVPEVSVSSSVTATPERAQRAAQAVRPVVRRKQRESEASRRRSGWRPCTRRRTRRRAGRPQQRRIVSGRTGGCQPASGIRGAPFRQRREADADRVKLCVVR